MSSQFEGNIGIALSGGGSRAMAFHLGCLRTLHHTGLLERAKVMSAVSGGAVIGAMYSLHDGPFEAFETAVRAALERGFLRPALRTAFISDEGLRAVLAFALTVGSSLWSFPVRLLGRSSARAPETSTLRRFASRTTILRRTLDDLLFHGRSLGSLPTGKPHFVAIAAELRTASAFYFSRREAGSWRFGRVDPTEIPIAHAVAASAAYPLMLPALDEVYTFAKRDGSLSKERVTLTDGGVYDNLGLAPLWPGRDSSVGVDIPHVDAIIACRAGYGLRTAPPSLFLGSRMKAVFGCSSGRVQNLTVNRLHDLKKSGTLKSFALPYLDQDDNRLTCRPADLVSRASVADYPTNFSAMTSEWIDRLSRRGEQLTLAVIQEHAPELLPRDMRSNHPGEESASAHGVS